MARGSGQSNLLFGKKSVASVRPKLTATEIKQIKFLEAKAAWIEKGGTVTEKDNRIFWKMNGEVHRDDDLPAIQCDEYEEWWCEGKLHRDGDKPAVVYSNGDQEWWHQYKLHRDDDKPAVIHTNGDKAWYQNDKLHRDGGLPAREFSNGDKMWYQNGQRHREDGPAVERANGEKQWFIRDMFQSR